MKVRRKAMAWLMTIEFERVKTHHMIVGRIRIAKLH
jgi:hypothetical protein